MVRKALSQIREQGISVLTESLGPVDAIRFLQQLDTGAGNYTASRQRILGSPTVDRVVDDIKRLPKRGVATPTPLHQSG